MLAAEIARHGHRPAQPARLKHDNFTLKVDQTRLRSALPRPKLPDLALSVLWCGDAPADDAKAWIL